MSNISFMMTVRDFLEKKDQEVCIAIRKTDPEIKIQLLSDRKYTIPAYQREIRWEEKNVNILIDDLKLSDKFLGTILLNKVDNIKYEIIDGQQRVSVFILILEAIKKATHTDFQICDFENETYLKLFDVMNLDFSKEKIENSSNKESYIRSDILDQRERFEKLWLAINKKIENKTPEEQTILMEKLLNCEINIIIADCKSKKYVDYYLDLNDKSVKLDNIDILKGNLFKINYDKMTAEWATVQRAIKELRMIGLENYSLSAFYYHYFACSVNEYLGFNLTTIKTHLKFDKDVFIDGHKYEAGTNILRAVKDQRYFSSAIQQLKDTALFFKNIYLNDGLSVLKDKLKRGHCDNDTILCMFSIISAIIRIDDEVPKMLIMKYFMDVLDKKTINKDDVHLIFYIYVYSILFTLTAGKKESSKLIRVVLSQDWKEKLKKTAIKLWEDGKDKINYWKRITANGKITDESGKYLPKHIIAIKEFATITNTSISFNQRKLKEFLTSSTCTAEHFFINKSHKVTFKYGPKAIESEMSLPKSITKYISCPVNYVYINSDANCNLGNLSIKEKIELLDAKEESVFSSGMNFKYFTKAKEAFDVFKSSYPVLSSFTNKAKAKSALLKYYKENLKGIMEKYVDLICTI